MKHFFGFDGRIGRMEFFYFFLFFVGANVIVRLWNPSSAFGLDLIAGLVFVVGCVWVYTCAIIKRLHDLDRSGWHYWLLLIPLYNIYLFGLLFFQKGSAEDY